VPRASGLAHKTLADAKAPADDDEKQRVEYVKGVESYSEYALYALALKLKDSQAVAELGAALEEQEREKPIHVSDFSVYLNALTQSGQAAKAVPRRRNWPTANAKDVDSGVNRGKLQSPTKRYDRAVTHSTQVLEALGSRPKPKG